MNHANPSSGPAGKLPSSSANEPLHGRRRRPRACDECWRRKIRCDDEEGRCRNCQIYNSVCKTSLADGAAIIRGPIETTPDLSAESGPRKRAKSLASAQSPISEQSSGSISTARHRLLNPPLDNSLSTVQRSPSIRTGNQTSLSLHDHERTQTLETALPTSAPADNKEFEGVVTIERARIPRKSKYAGRSSPQVLAKSAEELFKNDAIRINVMNFFCSQISFAEDIPIEIRAVEPLVERDTAMMCVKAYFSSFYALYPILPEVELMHNLETFYAQGRSYDAAAVCCINLAVILGCRAGMIREVDCLSLFRQAWSLHGTIIASPYLPSVQAFLLMSLELINQNKSGQAVLAVGTAVRIAQSLGLHRGLAAHKEPFERGFVERDYDLRRRIWWTCYCLDKKLSLEVGRPSHINEADCDVEVNEISSIPLDDAGYLFYAVRLYEVVSSALTSLFCKQGEPKTVLDLIKTIEIIDSKLQSWKNGLPPEYRPDGEVNASYATALDVGFALLRCTYYNLILIIYRPALLGTIKHASRYTTNSRIRSADGLCTNSARSLALVINELIDSNASWASIRWTSYYVLNVTFTLYVAIMKDPLNWRVDSDVALMKSMKRCFARGTDLVRTVTDFAELLDSLCMAILTAQQQATTGSQQIMDHGSADGVVERSDFQGTNDGAQTFENGPFDVPSVQFFDLESFFASNGGEVGSTANMQLWPLDFNDSDGAPIAPL